MMKLRHCQPMYIILTYTIRLRLSLTEVLLRKQEIRRCFVFPPDPSSASALPCEIGNPEDSELKCTVFWVS